MQILIELQQKMVETKQRLAMGESVKKLQNQKMKVAELTKTQLLTLEKSRPVFHSIGRMFILEDVDTEIAFQDAETEKAKEKIASIERQKEYLEKSLAESERNIREMVQSRP
uniref:Prefoldin subunit 1 n=1 Tax=Syphacia muris TaxID=451379 RepID=A0A0N5AGV3_9BILA